MFLYKIDSIVVPNVLAKYTTYIEIKKIQSRVHMKRVNTIANEHYLQRWTFINEIK